MARDHTPADRGLRDEANVGPDPRQARSLVPMRELDDYKVADGEPDIRGWRVFTSSGRELGRVEDLLVDTASSEVVMLDIDLRRNDRHTLAPIRAAWIDREHERVIIDSRELEGADEATVPTLARRGDLTDDEVREFGSRYDRAYGERGYEPERDYDVHHLADRLRFWHRRHDDKVLGDDRRAAADRPADDAARARSEEARTINDPSGADAAARAADRRDPVERYRADDAGAAAARRDAEARTAEGGAAERERRQREVDALNAERGRDRQVRFPVTSAPADVPRGRVVEETVVRRREVGPDEASQ
jgi:sporulation protein YlmC with PRC-barrel domain